MEDSDDGSASSASGSDTEFPEGSHGAYFRQCYRQPELTLPWEISVPQPAISRLHKTRPELFGGPVLDVGAGRGTTTIWIASKLGLDVVSCDVSPDAIHSAKERFEKLDEGAAVGAATFLVCDVCTELPASLAVGTVVDSACYHCIGEEQQQMQYVKAMAKCLRPSGYLLMLAFSDGNPEPIGGGRQLRRVSKDELLSRFGPESGFEVEDIAQCKYCCQGTASDGKGPIKFARKAWLMIARRVAGT